MRFYSWWNLYSRERSKVQRAYYHCGQDDKGIQCNWQEKDWIELQGKKIQLCGIGVDEYNKISSCETADEIWDCRQTAHEGTKRGKESKVDMLATKYENLMMKEGETICEINSRFTSITNELLGLGNPFQFASKPTKFLRYFQKLGEKRWTQS